MKVVIVGGVAGGASAAARIRRLDEQAEIVIFERSGHVSYANCGLPYYIGGAIEEQSALTLQTPESFRRRFRIQVHVRHDVLSIDREAKTVLVKNLETGETFAESYDKLVLAPGAKPIRPPFEGLDHPAIFTLRTVEDTLRIRNFADQNHPKEATVVGGGFIGLEVAENLCERGIRVTLVEKAPQLLAPLDEDMASFVHAKFRKKGVRLLLNTAVSRFEHDGEEILTHLDDGKSIRGQMVVLAIGVAPDATLAKQAGLELGVKGSIAVDAHMRTSDPCIFAVGDAVQVRHGVTGQQALVSLAGPANKQGRIAADNICGLPSVFGGAYGSSILKVFDMTAASTGINERMAKAMGLVYEKLVLSPANHASYYPGGRVMTMKVIYEKKTLRILGAQIVGFDGVDKRIDVLATAMQTGMQVTELKDLDLAYAPPYSSAKDPVNMAGFMAENIEEGLVKQFHYEQIALLPEDAVRLDTRTPEEFERGHAQGFVNLPLDELRERLGELDESKPIYVMCQSGLRSYLACRILTEHGFECYNFSGGYRLYESMAQNRFEENTRTSCGVIHA